jgi:hypothetical protein
MPNAKRLTKRQTAVIDDLFAGVDNEERILKRHRVKRRLYDKWMSDENFVAEFERRIQSARRQGELILARFASVAVAKLVALMESENQETSRKACLDIINLLRPNPESKPQEQAEPEQLQELAPELAGRLLEALAVNREVKTTINKRET